MFEEYWLGEKVIINVMDPSLGGKIDNKCDRIHISFIMVQ